MSLTSSHMVRQKAKQLQSVFSDAFVLCSLIYVSRSARVISRFSARGFALCVPASRFAALNCEWCDCRCSGGAATRTRPSSCYRDDPTFLRQISRRICTRKSADALKVAEAKENPRSVGSQFAALANQTIPASWFGCVRLRRPRKTFASISHFALCKPPRNTHTPSQCLP